MKTIIFTVVIFIVFTAKGFAGQAGKEKIVKILSFKPEESALSYELFQPAKVRIRIGVKEGPLLYTPVDWQQRGAGVHKEEWSDLDPSKRLTVNRDVVFTFSYFTGDDLFVENAGIEDIMPHPEQVVVGRFIPALSINRLHKGHTALNCHEPLLIVKLPKNVRIRKDGYFVIKDKARIIIDIAPKDKIRFSRERYSIHIFIDDVFLTGELEGYSPYNFIFDPVKFNKGKHIIAVNFSGFADHIGVLNIPVYIKKGVFLARNE